MAKIIDFENLKQIKQDSLLTEESRDKRILELYGLLEEIENRLNTNPAEALKLELKQKEKLFSDELTALLEEDNESYYQSLSKKEEILLKQEVNNFFEGLKNYHE